MKHSNRNRSDEEDNARLVYSISKEWPFRLVKVVSFLVIFGAGLVFGLAASSHVRYFTSTSELFFPTFRNPPIQRKNSYVAGERNCGKGECLDFWTFVEPIQLNHSMTDEQLFWRASMLPRQSKYPFKRVPKVAFMFLTRGPLPLSPLWDRFLKGHEELFSVYVHTLPGYKLDVTEDSAFYGRQIPSQEVWWGSPTLTDGERRLLANALLDFSNERFVLLSESCIPIYDFKTVYKYLIESAESFVDSYDDPSRYGRGRYSRSMLPDIRLYQWRKGSQWFEMSRFLAVNIISDTKYYTLFRKYCKPSCYPDEHYIPTYLNMFFGSLNSNRSVTWVDWSRGGPHPATFGGEDITEGFIEAIRNNGTECSYNSRQTYMCYLFARKFAPSALEPLLNLTSSLLKY
ncbi:hypothetical protein Scep_018423 [Stephania cephalantha]|uniref:Core-2/I-branching beta-1,6-N-acetylglucosaminyltransferase family protein n=1 Tax=Stephania cephalantha TaxID=152367 RepID=A0AAP0NLS6_9MAGN